MSAQRPRFSFICHQLMIDAILGAYPLILKLILKKRVIGLVPSAQVKKPRVMSYFPFHGVVCGILP